MPSDPRIEAYLNRIDRRLLSLPPERRSNELTELRSHLETLVRDHLLRGATHDEAVQGALEAFGKAETLGRDLARTGSRSRRFPHVLLAGLTLTLTVGATFASSTSAPWEATMQVASTFMEQGRAGDVNGASELFSLPERWLTADPGQLKVLFDKRRDVFSNFTSLKGEPYNVTVFHNLRAVIDGKVTLTDGTLVPFKASFINEVGTWKLQTFELS